MNLPNNSGEQEERHTSKKYDKKSLTTSHPSKRSIEAVTQCEVDDTENGEKESAENTQTEMEKNKKSN